MAINTFLKLEGFTGESKAKRTPKNSTLVPVMPVALLLVPVIPVELALSQKAGCAATEREMLAFPVLSMFDIPDMVTALCNVFKPFLPADPTEKLKAQEAASAAAHELAMKVQEGSQAGVQAAIELAKGQLEINKLDAASPSFFKSGWRPWAGWYAGTAFVTLVFLIICGSIFWGFHLSSEVAGLIGTLSFFVGSLFGMRGLEKCFHAWNGSDGGTVSKVVGKVEKAVVSKLPRA